jgi:hypothetical protein
MKTFKQYVLNEVGNSRNPYPFRLDGDFETTIDRTINDYRFTSDSNYRYRATVWVRGTASNAALVVVFSTVERSEHLTNAGLSDAFRVVATVIDIAKDAIKRYKKGNVNIKRVVFESSKWGAGSGISDKAGRGREKLYTAFIRKELDVAKIDTAKNNYGDDEIRVWLK